MKGCLQLGFVPNINNTINMVPVDHVARCMALAALHPLPDSALRVLHITARPRLTFNDMFSSLARYGYSTEQCEYPVWTRRLEKNVTESQENALFPLLHFVVDDLPSSTKAPELDDRNMQAVLKSQEPEAVMTVTDDTMGKYIAWLVQVGFLPAPTRDTEQKLPKLAQEWTTKAVGRSGA